jgi:NADH:ubiquinone oxidoreductase subunit 6 (subunit J)
MRTWSRCSRSSSTPGLLGIIRTPLGAPVPVHAGFGGTESLGERLFTVWLLPFELTSLLLLVAIVGAVVVGKKHLGG